MEPRIIKLAPSSAPISVSFEEAFGEYSEARGRGRARRKKRRLERIRNRQEVRRARREGRRERMRERQARRTERMQLRQQRKTQRKQARVERRALGQEEEPTDESAQPLPEEGQGGGGGYQPEAGNGQGGGGYQPQDQEVSAPTYSEEGDTQGDYTGNGEGEYGTTQDGDISYGNEEYGDIDAEVGESDIESGYTGDVGFDGVQQISPEDAMWDEYFASADGERSINPKVMYLSKQIEKTKEAIRILNDKATALKGKPGLGTAANLRNISSKISKLKLDLADQETLLASYVKSKSNIRSNADGDDYSEARGRRGKAAKRAEVRAAKRKARKERKAFRKSQRAAKRMARKEGRMERRGRRSATVVEMELDPQFSEQRIEVPAEDSSEFAGTGLIGIDDANDYDAPDTRKFDLKFSGADGSGSAKSGNLGKVAIGVGLGVLAVYLYNKFKK